MKLKQLVAAVAVALFAAGASAQNVVLVNEYIKAGVNVTTGTLGSGGNTPPGLQYDSTGTGTFNAAYDYLTPGSPYEGWAVKIINGGVGTTYHNNNAYVTQVTGGTWVGTPTSSSAVWAVSHSNFDLQHNYSLPSGRQYLDITTSITAKIAMDGLYFGRFIDPDARAAAGDSSSTDNVRGYGVIPKTNVVFSEALASRYALGLYTTRPSGSNTSISPTWSSDPQYYYNNTGGSDVVRGDYTIGIAFYSSGLAVGDIVTYNYAYIFGPSAFGAATTAISGGAGGGTAGTSSFGTLTDVGSATSAASTPAAPTVTGTSTAIITVSDTTTVDSGLPVITASLAHHTATQGGGKQTIARETTTNVTTPMVRTLVTKTRTTTTYSDSTTTYSDSAPSTGYTYSNSVATSVANDSFSGRIDQMAELGNLNSGINRTLNMNAFRKDGYRNESGAVYINANKMSSSMANGYSADTRIYGIAVETNADSNWRIGAQYNRVDTKMNGVDSQTSQGKNQAGLYSIYNLDDWIIVNNLGYAENSISSNRNVENLFFNSHNTSGNDIWLNNRVYTPSLEGFRPFAGYTFGRNTLNGYTERGSIQSYRTVGSTNTSNNYGEVGLLFDQTIDGFIFAVEGSTTTDSYNTVNAAVGYEVDKFSTVAITGTRQMYKSMTSNMIGVQGIIRF